MSGLTGDKRGRRAPVKLTPQIVEFLQATPPIRSGAELAAERHPAKFVPNYYCQGSDELVAGRGLRHTNVGGLAIDTAVTDAFLTALAPAALHVCLAAAEQLEARHDAALAQHRRQDEQAQYQANKAERRYRAVEPDNRLVARGLETEWNTTLQLLADAEAELGRRELGRRKVTRPRYTRADCPPRCRRCAENHHYGQDHDQDVRAHHGQSAGRDDGGAKTLTATEMRAILALGDDLNQVWSVPPPPTLLTAMDR